MALGVRGWVDVSGDGWEFSPHTCTHMCMHTHMHTHACVINMIISCKWLPPLGESMEFPMMSYTCACVCVCMHAHMCACVWGHPFTTPTPIHPPPTPRGTPWNQSKFNSTWTNRDISILFEDLKSVETPPPLGGCIVWWVGGWVDGWGQVKSLKI